MTPRRTTAKNLKRKTANRPERKTVVIFCAGKASEPDYINGLKRLPNVHSNTSINIEVESRSHKLDGRSGKRINADQYIPHRYAAARRASSLSCRHERDRTLFPHDNPSSMMSDLLTAISAMEP
ncbi:MAG: hypothetical protein ACRDQ4_00240 [Pseudonocardiaceae bacterium]